MSLPLQYMGGLMIGFEGPEDLFGGEDIVRGVWDPVPDDGNVAADPYKDLLDAEGQLLLLEGFVDLRNGGGNRAGVCRVVGEADGHGIVADAFNEARTNLLGPWGLLER